MRHAFALAVGMLLSISCTFVGAADPALFPRPASLEPAIRFWTRVYTEIGTSSGFIHDNEHLDVVYETIHVPSDASRRERNRQIERATERYRDILTRLGRGQHDKLSEEERRVLELWPKDVTTAELKRATQNLRFQLGQANRFRAGLARSSIWRPYIEQVMRERGLPIELAALPHVESSFDPTAYSKVGAAGMWQFTRSTGLRYMRIDHVIDERRDPFMSTKAAAQLLADNYAVIESWPLALTAYNHGLAGMRRAADRLNTKDIEKIIANYESRSFGFASRNFYAAFLAAVDVDSDPERYFGKVAMEPASDTQVVQLPDYIAAADLAAALEVDLDTLAAHNPALMPPVWSGDKLVPRGFELRLPGRIPVTERLAAIPEGQRHAAQRPDLYHQVRPGDTLSRIAQQYRVSLNSLMAANGLDRRDIIRVGQRISLPGQAGAGAALAAASPPAASPTPAPARAAVAVAATSVAADEDGIYVVRSGDSIERITRRLGVDAASLMAFNDIDNPDRIYAGQRLRVAGMPEPVTTAATEQPLSAAQDADLNSPAVDSELEPAVSAVSASARPDDSPVAVVAALAVDVPADMPAANALEAGAPAETTPEPSPLGLAIAASYAAAIGAEPMGELTALAEDASADALGTESTNALATEQAELAADPSDYSVAAADGSIEVQALETLGHYADWLGIRTQRLRDINGFAFGRSVAMGQRIKLDFSQVDPATFEQRRVSFHREQQENFFRSHQITDTVAHTVRPGESLWVLAARRYQVPVWLLRQYNPDLDLSQVRPGAIVKFPRLEPVQSEDAQRDGVAAA